MRRREVVYGPSVLDRAVDGGTAGNYIIAIGSENDIDSTLMN